MPTARAKAGRTWAGYLSFYERHAPLLQLIFGAFLVVVSVVLVAIALQVASDHSRSEHSAKIACQRAREFGPPLGTYFARVHALTPAELEDYRASIPRVC